MKILKSLDFFIYGHESLIVGVGNGRTFMLKFSLK